MKRLPPPARLQPDKLEIELHEMARGVQLGLPRFPPPPPPPRSGAAAMPSAEPPIDVIRRLVPLALCIALAIPLASAWYVWTH